MGLLKIARILANTRLTVSRLYGFYGVSVSGRAATST